MEQINQRDYDEISLRELIETLLDGWKMIAIITVICVLASAVFSFFIIEPKYEAKTTMMASLATDKLSNMDIQSENIDGILNSFSSYPIMTLQTYKEQIKNSQILLKTIEELNLAEKDITVDSLANMISLQTIADTNLIIVKASHTDPELAAKIANTVTENFTYFITDLAKNKASQNSSFINSQLEVEKTKLDEALLELKEFLAQPRGVDELRAEVGSKLSELNSYKDRLSREEIDYKDELLDKEMEENKISAELQSARVQLSNTPEKLTTEKSITDDSTLSDIVKEETNSSTKDISDIKMESEEINPTYLTLKEKVDQYEIDSARVKQEKENIEFSYNRTKENLEDKINDVKKELESLQVELADKEHNEKLIQRKVNLSQSTYDSFLDKYEATRIAEATEVGESSITIVSKSIVPKNPVSPNKVLNLAIGGVLGVMLGVFIAFFRHYWKTSAEA
ncbi:GumC family protein [Sporosalibacterium faouarense]|uniref:GumC family protein n=1 Tax=Sporosalibacterium faouarense TaxID=516123 RepID=UPI00192B8E1E|nr:GNVR domain-containing protein [Sporosalibacterium faouarense]